MLLNPFAAVLTSYLVRCYLVAVCPNDEYTRHASIVVMLSAVRSVAEILLLVGTWHAIGYLWGAAPNVTEISPGSWQRRG